MMWHNIKVYNHQERNDSHEIQRNSNPRHRDLQAPTPILRATIKAGIRFNEMVRQILPKKILYHPKYSHRMGIN